MKNIEDIYELSPMQQGMLFDSLAVGDTGLYRLQIVYELRGELEVEAFERAWRDAFARHAILRTSFEWKDLDKPLQIVHREVALPLEHHDWSELSESEQMERFERALREDRVRPIDFGNAPLMRLALIRLAHREYRFVWSIQHILMEGWSASLLLQEVFASYDAFRRGETPDTDERRPYRDYILWLQEQDHSRAETYWRSQLAGFTAPTPLPLDGSTDRLVGPVLNHDRHLVWLSPERTEALQVFAQSHRLTLNTLVQGAWALILSRYSGENDVVFGGIVSGRSASLDGIESIIGLCVNILPVRVKLSPKLPILSWLKEIQEQQLYARDFEHSALFDVQGWSEVRRGTSLFESLLVFENWAGDIARLGDLEVGDLRAAQEGQGYPLTVVVEPRKKRLGTCINYDRRRFDGETIRRILRHFHVSLERMLEDPQRRLSEFSFLTEAERRQLLVEWNDTARELPGSECVHRLFENQVERSPDAVAVVADGEQLTYKELNQRSNRLANHLRTLGVGPEVLVGLLVERSLDMVVALLAVLKAGGAYVPLDPTYPKDRLAFMIRDAQLPILLTRQRFLEVLPPHDAHVVCLDTDWHTVECQPPENPIDQTAKDSLAYVIYTSGSTGTPKGVMIEHRSLANFVAAALEAYSVRPRDRVLQFASLSFDAAAEEIYPTLAAGATLVLRTDSMLGSVREFLQKCRDWMLTIIDLPTAYWHQLVEGLEASALSLPPTLRLVIIGGEKASPRHFAAWQKRVSQKVRLINTYGPTETTVVSSMWEAPAEPHNYQVSGEVPIGSPIANTQVYVLDRHGNPSVIGVEGELHIGGHGLARGYLNRQDLTAKSFIPNRFSQDPEARLYKTGDLVRYLPDGTLEFRGRVDHQVKIRGFRVELGEIEAVLAKQPGVCEVIVLAREHAPADTRLTAYLVPDHPQTLSANSLRDFARSRLPDYMVPSAFVMLDAMPLTPNGKVDLDALPAPGSVKRDEPEFVSPRTPAETLLAKIWCELLGLDHVSVHDNFFDVGGHSLLAVQVITRFEEATGFHLNPAAFFPQTLAQLAASFEGQVSDRPVAAPADATAQIIEPLFFGGNDGRLFGCFRFARAPRNRGVVLCHPHAHEYLRCHRAQRLLAERLSMAGYHVLSFDYYGCGDSEGEYAEGRIRDWCTDVTAAVDTIKTRFRLDRVCLVGLRLGATIAMMVGAEREDVDAVALWDPIVQGSDIAEELIRIRKAQSVGRMGDGSPNDILSYCLTKEMEDDLRRIDLTAIRSLSIPHALVLETEGGTPAGSFSGFLEGVCEDVRHERVTDARVWLREPFEAIVPQQTLQTLVAWISRVCP